MEQPNSFVMVRLIIALLLALLIGYGLSVLYRADVLNFADEEAQTEEVSSGEGTIITGPTVAENEPVTSIVGRILSISGDTITMTADSPLGMSDDPTLQERTVTLNDATVVSTFVERDPELVKQEMEELKKRIAENERMEAEARAAGINIPPTPTIEIPDVPPVMYEKQAAEIGALGVGQVVGVTAAADIRTQKSFDATSIDIISVAAPRS